MQRPMKRIVTGHDDQGRAIVSIEGAPPHIAELEHIPGTVFYELWKTTEMPAPIDSQPVVDPTLGPLRLPPYPNGTTVRIVDIPPDTEEFLARGAEKMASMFAHIGSADATTVKKNSPHPLMHRTETIDYGILIEGELVLILDEGEATLKPGDVVIQRGTNHAWANRSGAMCRIAFILVDGCFDPALKAQFDASH